MLQQFLIKQKKSNLSIDEIVSIMSEFLLASFDTVLLNFFDLYFIFNLGLSLDMLFRLLQRYIFYYTN